MDKNFSIRSTLQENLIATEKSNLITTLKYLWSDYIKDPVELHRMDLNKGESVFNANRFILWLLRK